MRSTFLIGTFVFLLVASATLIQHAEASEAARTGEFQLTFTITEVAGPDTARVVETAISPDEQITWEVYVPDSYQSEKPAGLMVYISPSKSGEIPQRWKSVMDRYNIIWISANRSGNKVLVARRAIFAIVAPTLASKHYKIDNERIYLSGLSTHVESNPWRNIRRSNSNCSNRITMYSSLAHWIMRSKRQKKFIDSIFGLASKTASSWLSAT